MAAPLDAPFVLDTPTLLSLGLVFSFLPIAQIAAAYLLPNTIRRKYYYLFLYCAFDVLTHSIVEGSYLYHCFFSYIEVDIASDYPHPAAMGRLSSSSSSSSSAAGLVKSILPGPFLGRGDRVYGAWYSTQPLARLWQEYAKADRRWGGADPTIISLELLTVFGAGPLAFYICTLIVRLQRATTPMADKATFRGKVWFSAIVLSTAELYGGFITFAPEWLTNNTLLNVTNDPVYLWLYLAFFNLLWVFIPLWILWEAWIELGCSGAVVGAVEVQDKKSR